MKFVLKLVNYLKRFDSDHVYNEKRLRTKVKSSEKNSVQTFIITKYQKMVLNISTYQQY